MRKGIILTLLVAVLALGVFFRMSIINDTSLWLDEGITYYNSTAEDLSGVWDKTAELDQSPPGYYFVMHYVLELFGENEFAFRFVPLVFGVLSVLVLYLLIAAMFGAEAGVIAALLLAINPFHIGFSVESRMYVLLSLEALLGFYFLYKAMMSKRGVNWYWLGFILSCIAGLYTHNFFVFSLVAFLFIFFWLFIGSERGWWKFFMGGVSAIAVVLAYIPWIPNFLEQMEVERYWMAANSLSDIKEYFLDFVNDKGFLLLGFLFLILVGIVWTLFRTKAQNYKNWIFAEFSLLIFLVIGIGFPLGYSLFFEPIMKVRYMVYLLPIFVSLVAVGIYALRRFSLVLAGVLLVGVFYLWMPLNVSEFPVEFGEDYRGLSEVVSENPAPVVVHTPSITHVINFYNRGDFAVLPFPESDDLNQYNIFEEDKDNYLGLVSGMDDFYLVVTHTHENPPGLLYVWSDGICEETYKIGVKGMEVYYFDGCGS